MGIGEEQSDFNCFVLWEMLFTGPLNGRQGWVERALLGMEIGQRRYYYPCTYIQWWQGH